MRGRQVIPRDSQQVAPPQGPLQPGRWGAGAASGARKHDAPASPKVVGNVSPRIKVPADVATCKSNLFTWLSELVDEMNMNKDGVIHCWKSTGLLRAWEGEVQLEAAGRVAELFPNLDPADAQCTADVVGRLCAAVHDDATVEDASACYAGQAFTTEEHGDEWVEWVDWGQVPAADAAGSSSA